MPKYRYAVLDIETTGLDRFKDQINYIGIGLAEDMGAPLGKTYILNMHKSSDKDKFLRIVQQLKDKKLKLIWQNGKFDTLFIERHYGVLLPIHYDVMLMGTAYELATSHSLDDMAEKYLGIPSWDIALKEKIKPNNPIVEKYLVKDLTAPWELFCYFYNRMTEQKWMHHNILLKKAYMMYRKAERRGIYFDKKKHIEVKRDYALKAKQKLKILNDRYNINWNSPKQVQDVLFEKEGIAPIKLMPSGAPSADAKVLRRLVAKGLDLPQKLMDYKFFYGANTKFLNKWGIYASYDGRIHPSFGITNVITGRTSCKNPNLQQVPRNPELRTMFTAAPGRSLIEADYQQIELKIAADYADERTMKKIYRSGGDIHHKTATLFRPDPTKDDRTKAKAVNFGFLFGMQAKGFVNYAFDSYNAIFTLAEATQKRDEFFSTYSGLLPWHKEMEIMCEANGGVANRFGRFRALPDIYSPDWGERNGAVRRAINTPVQSTASDLLLLAAIEVDHKLSREMDLYVVGTVHDAILVDCPDEYIEEASREIKRIMSHPEALDIFGVEFSVPITADVGVGPWGSK